jgi:urease accessory protein
VSDHGIAPQALPNARLLQLASQCLPTGSYAYSGGLEAVVSLGIIQNQDDAGAFLSTLLLAQVGHLEIPYAVRMFIAWTTQNPGEALSWSRRLRASRESRELREQDGQMGRAVARVFCELYPSEWERGYEPCTYAEALARSAVLFGISKEDLALVVAYGWAEQHVMAVSRLLTLGPIASQRLLGIVIEKVAEAICVGLAKKDDEIGSSAPILGIASAKHEEQYTRIFRS